MRNRRDFLRMAAAPALGHAAPAQAAPGGRPNIVIVMADQLRAGLTRRTGFPLDTMPALDRLAGRGIAFDRAYTTAPLCVPARVSMLTGRWPHAHRVRQNSAGRHAVYAQDLFQVVKGLGYRTGLAGKNHSYLTAERLDFFRTYGHADGWMPKPEPPELVAFQQWMKEQNFATGKQATPFPLESQFPYRIVSDAIEFLKEAGDQPFALWVSFPEPHNPYQVPKPYFDMFPPDRVPARDVGPEALAGRGFKWEWLRKLEESTYPGYANEWRRTRSNYLGMMRLIDDQLDRLLRHLDLERTIVLFLADHGDYFCDYGLERKGVELPDVLIRVPMVWAGAGIRRRSDGGAFVSCADVMPTLCEALGAPIPPGAQGRSLWPMLRGDRYPAEEFRSVYAEVGFGGMYYGAADRIDPAWGRTSGPPGAIPGFDGLNPVTQCGNLKMVRMGDWKLTFDMMGNGRLYRVSEDPYELKDLYTDPKFAAVRADLTAELLRWTVRTEDDLPLAAYKHKWAPRNWYAPLPK
jgi:arylsulfatase A-like enzyme